MVLFNYKLLIHSDNNILLDRIRVYDQTYTSLISLPVHDDIKQAYILTYTLCILREKIYVASRKNYLQLY